MENNQILIQNSDGSNATVDESLLLRRDIVAEDDDDKKVDVREYCWIGCAGEVHTTGSPAMCEFHVHRSVHVTVKRWPEGMVGSVTGFGE